MKHETAGKRIRTTAHLPADLWKQLQQYAHAEGLSQSTAIGMAIRRLLRGDGHNKQEHANQAVLKTP